MCSRPRSNIICSRSKGNITKYLDFVISLLLFPRFGPCLNVVIVYLEYYPVSSSYVHHNHRHATSHSSRVVGVVGAILGSFQRRVSLPRPSIQDCLLLTEASISEAPTGEATRIQRSGRDHVGFRNDILPH